MAVTVKRKNPAAVALGRIGGKKGGPAAATSGLDTSKKALHLCLRRIKEAKNESELRRLTQELQRIVFHRQYRNAEN